MSVPKEEEIRKQKRDIFKEAGINPYPAESHRTATCGESIAAFASWEQSGQIVTLAGRVMVTRVHGGMIFADLQDATGSIQLLLKEDDVDVDTFTMFRDLLDPADVIEATGILMQTRRGEKSLKVSSWQILTKALLPLPEKWHGLQDVEQRYRFRELDLLSSADVRAIFKKRSAVIRSLRRLLEDDGFEEVETPILQAIPGGGTARPFVTHHNALDVDFYLRIAPELFLKRLIVGGYEKVFEIGRQFRNEGIDRSHNPEFTSLEFYWAYQDYKGLMDFTEMYLKRVIQEVNESLTVVYGDVEIDFSAPWARVSFADAIRTACGIDIRETSQDDLVKKMKALKIDVDYKTAGLGKLYDELYKETVRAKQVQPIFIIDYPIEMEPLAKRSETDPRFVERFQLIVAGMEMLKAYSELNDPEDQRTRFEDQQALREAGDDEAQQIDDAFLTSLAHGMPPTAGWGMGVDRFVSLLANVHNIKDVILFPTLRPAGRAESEGEENK
ncbi:MAG: lysine--tRNA ligase [bacterium]|nr:lysine--tRNA ligase [bacterium]